jgi:hypothetical protein
VGELIWESGASGVWVAAAGAEDQVLVRRFRSSRAGASPGTFGWRLLMQSRGRSELLVSTHATRREAQDAAADLLRGRPAWR